MSQECWNLIWGPLLTLPPDERGLVERLIDSLLDLDYGVRIAATSKKILKSHQDIVIKQDSPEIVSTTLEEDESSGNSSLEEKFLNEIDSINDEESIMSGSEKIPSLMHNSPKYWNNFEKRWKGTNPSRSRHFSHRNDNDWYNQQYSDKFSNRNTFNNHHSNFNRVRRDSRGIHNNQNKESYKEVQNEQTDESPNIKNNVVSSDDTNNSKHFIKENGINDDTQSKENDSSLQNDSSPQNGSSTSEKNNTIQIEKDSDPKENEQIYNESKVSNEQEIHDTVEDVKSDFVNKAEEAPIKAEEVAKNNEQKDEEFAKTDEEAMKENIEVVGKDEEVVKNNEEVVKEGEEVMGKDEEMTKEDKEVAKKDEEVIEEDEEVVEKNEEVEKQAEEVVEKNGEMVKKDEEVEKSKEDSLDEKLSDSETISETKDCDASMTEHEKQDDSKSENISEEKLKINIEITNEETKNNLDCLLNKEESTELEEESTDNKGSGEIGTQISEVALANSDIVEENSMDIDEHKFISDDDKNSIDDQTSEPGTTKKCKEEIIQSDESIENNVVEDLELDEKLEDKECIDQMENETESTTENSSENLNDVAVVNEESNSAQDDKSMVASEMDTEILETELNDDKENSVVDNVDKIDEAMEIEIDTESSSSLSSGIAEVKSSDSNDSKSIIERALLNLSPLIVEEDINGKAEKTMTKAEEEAEEERLLRDPEDTIEDEKSNKIESKEVAKLNSIIEEVDLVEDEAEAIVDSSEVESTSSKTNINAENDVTTPNKDMLKTIPIHSIDNNKNEESNEDGRAVVHKRRRRKYNTEHLQVQTDNGIRQKRRSAQNAEEMIRKEILKDDDEESGDESSKLVPVHYKKINSGIQDLLPVQPLSPPTLKRTLDQALDDVNCITENATIKRIKAGSEGTPVATLQPREKKPATPTLSPSKAVPSPSISRDNLAETKSLVRKIAQEDIRGKLKTLTQEELEAMLLQKIVECITIRGEMGKLREQAKQSKRSQEATRVKCQQLQKQVEGFDMVLKRISYDKNTNGDKFIPPIKINRSVGLQVNFLSDHGIQNLKQIQALKSGGNHPNATAKAAAANQGATNITQENRPQPNSPRKMMKTRSPRRPEGLTPTITQTVVNGPNPISVTQSSPAATISPNTVVVNKPILEPPMIPKRTITLQNSGGTIMQIVPPSQQQQPTQQQQPQTVVVNAAAPKSPIRPPLTVHRTTSVANTTVKASDLIDLTDEEDKSKTPVVTPMTSIASRFPRVLQAVPASVALSNPNNIRLVQAGSQGPQAAIVNNAQRLTYVMQSGVNGVSRQLVLANPNQIRPVTNMSSRTLSTINYKQGGVPLTNGGSMRVLTTQAPTANIQMARHPAPLPETPIPASNPTWKLPPPAPSLKISKVATGIVLSWNMTLSDKFAEIVSYQLYAYQEVAGTAPSATLWKKVGDVRALPLPMACTLTQFTEGNNYYFAVRAVDIHSRFGQYSKPGNISL